MASDLHSKLRVSDHLSAQIFSEIPERVIYADQKQDQRITASESLRVVA